MLATFLADAEVALGKVSRVLKAELCAHPVLVRAAFDAAVVPLVTGFCVEQPELCPAAAAGAQRLVDLATSDFLARVCK